MAIERSTAALVCYLKKFFRIHKEQGDNVMKWDNYYARLKDTVSRWCGLKRVTSRCVIAACFCMVATINLHGQDIERHENIEDAVIYDYDPSTKLGDDIYGTIIADFSEPVNGQERCSHGGPVCMEYANGNLAAFYANTSSHNSDGWNESSR